MKKIFKFLSISTVIIIAIVAVIAFLAGCKSMAAEASSIKVGLITFGDVNEAGFNWLSYQGLLRAESELGVIGTVYTTTEPSEIEPNVQQCALDDNDLCIGVGFMAGNPILNSAMVFTNTKFATLDVSYESYPPNLRGVLFASQEVGYLAGTLAGLMSQSDTIGAVCGMEIPPVTAFSESYRNGAICANPDITTIISYTNTFVDPDLGAQLAQSQITRGADVIFGVGGSTGNGAILTATQSDVWGIGVDFDQYYTLFMSGTVEGSDFLLTSAMKFVDTGVFNTISDVVSGTFVPGTITYDLMTEGVGLASFHEAEASVPSSVRTQLDWVKRAIVGGAIDPLDPNSPCLVKYQLFLPLTQR